MNVLHQIANSSLSFSVVMTLFHLLWVGLLIGMAAAVGNWLAKRSSAAVRYRWNMACLIAFLISAPACFAVVLTAMEKEIDGRWLGAASAVPMDNTVFPADLPDTNETAAAGGDHFAEHHALRIDSTSFLESQSGRYAILIIASVYSLGVLTMLGRLVMAMVGCQRIKHSSTPVSDPRLLDAVRRQARELGIRILPSVGYCERVLCPVVVGVLKPMILLPGSIATGLSRDQLQAVLMHELAHIRRWDHWMIVVQRTAETLLFFHPAVWYLSRRIHLERENCCDDLVVAAGQRTCYIESLLRVAELRLMGHGRLDQLATLAADGHQPSRLRYRICRILGEPIAPNVHLGLPSFLTLATCGAIALLLLTCFSLPTLAEPGPAATEADAGQPPTEAAPRDERPMAAEAAPAKEQEKKAKLKFLQDVPEFHDLDLKMTHDEFQKIVTKRSIQMHVNDDSTDLTYVLHSPRGECVIVMFQDKVCTGVQRMQRVPAILKGGGEPGAKTVTLELAADGTVVIDKQKFKSDQEVKEYLAKKLTKDELAKATLVLRVDREAKQGGVIALMDAAKEMGVLKFTFGVLGEKRKAGPMEADAAPADWFLPAPFPEFGYPQVGRDYQNYVRLACHPSVMADLGASDMQQETLTRLQEELNVSLRKLIAGLTPEERKAKAKELHDKRVSMWNGTRKVVELALTEKQRKRMKQIELQRHRHAVFFYPELAPELKITTDQVTAMRGKLAEHTGRVRAGANGQQSYKEFWGDVYKTLSLTQRKKFEELRGLPVGHRAGYFRRPRRDGDPRPRPDAKARR